MFANEFDLAIPEPPDALIIHDMPTSHVFLVRCTYILHFEQAGDEWVGGAIPIPDSTGHADSV